MSSHRSRGLVVNYQDLKTDLELDFQVDYKSF